VQRSFTTVNGDSVRRTRVTRDGRPARAVANGLYFVAPEITRWASARAGMYLLTYVTRVLSYERNRKLQFERRTVRRKLRFTISYGGNRRSEIVVGETRDTCVRLKRSKTPRNRRAGTIRFAGITVRFSFITDGDSRIYARITFKTPPSFVFKRHLYAFCFGWPEGTVSIWRILDAR